MDTVRGRWALVTGASGGLGADFCWVLAEHGANVVLVARSEARLRTLASELHRAHNIETEVVVMDLSRPDSAELLEHLLDERKIDVDILVNNAGFGTYGALTSSSVERVAEMVRLNVSTLVELSARLLRRMEGRRYGYLLQVGSVASYQPCPSYAVYGATKAFVHSFGVALAHELLGTGVSCTVIDPGTMQTGFFEVSGQTPTIYQRLLTMKSRDVARRGIAAMIGRKRVVVPGLLNRLVVFFSKRLPEALVSKLAYHTMNAPR